MKCQSHADNSSSADINGSSEPVLIQNLIVTIKDSHLKPIKGLSISKATKGFSTLKCGIPFICKEYERSNSIKYTKILAHCSNDHREIFKCNLI